MAESERPRKRPRVPYRKRNDEKNDKTACEGFSEKQLFEEDIYDGPSVNHLLDCCISVKENPVDDAMLTCEHPSLGTQRSRGQTSRHVTCEKNINLAQDDRDDYHEDDNQDDSLAEPDDKPHFIDIPSLSVSEVDNLVQRELLNSDPELDALLREKYDDLIITDHERDDQQHQDDSDCELQINDGDESACVNQANITEDQDESQPLFPGATMTVGAFMLLLGLYFTKHNSTGDDIVQLLNILAIAFPNGNKICTTLSGFKKIFCNLKNPLIHHYYCSHCLGYIGEQEKQKCPYSVCGKTLDEKTYFLEMSVETQIKNLFLHEGFTEKLQERFNRQMGTFKDIYDGTLYKSYCENGGPLRQAENISFTFNTDGAPVFKSSKVSVWPLFLVVNELPYQVRMKRENMILAGLWFGNQKPTMGTYLCPFLKTFNHLNEGIECYSPSQGNFTCRGFLLCGTADLPARCLLCNSIQFNGAFACWKCKQKGETAKVGKGHTHVFPFIPGNPKGPERTKNCVIEDAKRALDNQDSGLKVCSVNGIKGPSWLSFFPRFDIVDGIAIDYMHGVLLGVQKLLLKLWFSVSYKGKPYNIHDLVLEVDKRLLNIKPTLNISRLPRSIHNDLKYWKASEFRSFLLYFGAPVLLGILDQTRFSHFLLLVNAMHILLKCGSSEAEVNEAENFLHTFCQNFELLYAKCYMTLNIHQLVHLADSVRKLGPLYTHSCFSFEDKNGFMLKMIRGTQNIDNQIITGVSFLQKLPELKHKYIEKDTELDRLYESIDSPSMLKRGTMLENGTYVLGAIKMRTLLDDENDKMCEYFGYALSSDSFQCFHRLELHNKIIYSSEYGRMTKRDNSAIMYTSDNGSKHFGRVRCFLLVTKSHITKAVALVETLDCSLYDEHLSLLSVKRTNDLSIASISSIQELCMFISVSTTGRDQLYVCRFPNTLESD